MKKIIVVACVAVVAAFAGYNIYSSQEKNALSDLALSNVEALADGNEYDGGCEGCAMYAPGICKDWGWGGCIGKNTIFYT